jgi:hypothetical protein
MTNVVDLFNQGEPDLPYAGSSGWSGSQTSQDRAVEADGSGRTRDRQRRALRCVADAGSRGITWKELDLLTGWEHHGTTSGALSVLHKVGKIARLKQARDKCAVYVLPEFVLDREVSPQRSSKAKQDQEILQRIIAEVDRYPAFGMIPAYRLISILRGLE